MFDFISTYISVNRNNFFRQKKIVEVVKTTSSKATERSYTPPLPTDGSTTPPLSSKPPTVPRGLTPPLPGR